MVSGLSVLFSMSTVPPIASLGTNLTVTCLASTASNRSTCSAAGSNLGFRIGFLADLLAAESSSGIDAATIIARDVNPQANSNAIGRRAIGVSFRTHTIKK
ncbi:MAG: hypothetical protein DWI02_04205 [Planctomycetota bacterium]|nr:MAG: hypothetical protein DWI02_04205 [Planctomycetota bacterium]